MAGICNLEENKIPNAKINYQMLQTLTDVTNLEAIKLSKQSVNKINAITSEVKNMQEAFWGNRI